MAEAILDDLSRLLSAYKTLKGVKLWIITEAEDDDGHRAATTILLPTSIDSPHRTGKSTH